VKRAAPYLLFAGVTLAVFWRFLLFGQTMYAVPSLGAQFGDPQQPPHGWFVSAYRHTRIGDNIALLAGHLRRYNEGLKSNELRLWNPSLFCGLPTYADPMLHPFYPPNLLLHRIFSPDVGYELFLMLHLFFSGVAMYLLLRRGAERSDAASTAGALVWMLGGYNAAWFSTGILAGVSVFGPLAFLAILRGIDTKDRTRAALAGAAMGLAILGSHPQHAVLTFLFLLGYIAYTARRVPEARPFLLRFGTIFALLSVGVGLVDILTRLDTIENGYRDPVYDQIYFYSEPWRLPTYALGMILGKVYFPGAEWEAEFSVYAGLAATTLAVVGAWRHWSDPRVRAAAVAAAASLGIAYLYPLAWAFSQIPILSLSPPSRCLFLAGFCVAFLASQGLDALLADTGRTPRASAVATGVITAAFAIAALIRVGSVRFSNGAAIETAIGFGLAAAAAFAATRWKRPALGLALAAILFELLPPFMMFNEHGDSSRLLQVPESVRLMRGNDGSWRGSGILGTSAPSTKSDQWMSDLVTGNNLLALYGVDNIAGFEAIVPRSYVAYARLAGAKLSPAGRTVLFTKFDSALLDAVALKYVLLPAALPMPSRFRKLQDFGSVSLFENRAALPRARLAPSCVTVKDEEEAEARLRDPRFDPRSTVLVESEHPLPDSSGGRIAWKEVQGDRLALDVTSPGRACLVLADSDYPGWEASIDGVPAPILRANLAFRALDVPPGTHRVEFRFRPASVRHGLVASTLFFLLSLGAAFTRRTL
jgi:hypothetical protein